MSLNADQKTRKAKEKNAAREAKRRERDEQRAAKKQEREVQKKEEQLEREMAAAPLFAEQMTRTATNPGGVIPTPTKNQSRGEHDAAKK
jgi:transcription elongation GreA/GreB family factor